MRNLALCLLALGTACTQIVPAPAPPDAPRIVRFAADATRVSLGTVVTLSFETTAASNVSLVDDEGSPIALEGDVAAGEVRVSPSRTTFYVLRATGPGGTASAFVQVAVDAPLRDAFLVAVPPEIESGQTSQLIWSAPGANSVTLTEENGTPQALTGTSGVVAVTPELSGVWKLVAQGAQGTPPVEVTTPLRVRPAVETWNFQALNGLRPGELVTFSWRTRGGTSLTITERTFGQLTSVTNRPDVGEGVFAWRIPATLPSGGVPMTGFPLQLTLTVDGNGARTTRTRDTTIGDVPAIPRLKVPEYVTLGRTVSFDWRTINATKLVIRVGTQVVFETTEATEARAATGTVTLPAPIADTTYIVEAQSDRGSTTEQRLVRPVPLPVIDTFTTPATSTTGQPVTAQWTTRNATRLVLRPAGGPALARISGARVAQGSEPFALGSTAMVTLEAFNAAGDFASSSRLINLGPSPITVTPPVALRQTATATARATLAWDLRTLGVTAIEGVAATSGPRPTPMSGSFIDLTTSPTAKELEFADPATGDELLPTFEDFEFSLAGQVQRELWVSVDGFIAFSKPSATGSNTDLSSDSSSTQSMLAVFWDELILGSGRVLYDLQRPIGQDPFLVVTWDRVALQATPSEVFTFQAHLYPSGRVTYVYGPMGITTGSTTNATVGVKSVEEAVRQVYLYNASTPALAQDLALDWFDTGPAQGTLEVGLTRTRQVQFFGRTATGRLPFSVPLRTVAPGEVQISEVNVYPVAATLGVGQWVELHNTTQEPIQLEGMRLTLALPDGGVPADGGTTLPPLELAPDGYAVFAQSTNPVVNGGVTAQGELVDVPMGGQNEALQLTVQNGLVNRARWTTGTSGQSLYRPQGVLLAPDDFFACARTATFGPDGANGTPGAPNERCTPFTATPIDGGYVDPSPAATPLLVTETDTSGYGVVPLPAPFTYFGQTFNSLNLCHAAGFFTFSPTAFTSTTCTRTNQTELGALPNGVVAPFWDTLTRNSGTFGQGMTWLERLTDRTVMTWQDYRHSSDSTSRIDVQVHLLDTGVIEFHYGTLRTSATSASSRLYVQGSSATRWLESPDGRAAVPLSINTPVLRPFTSIRLTPGN